VSGALFTVLAVQLLLALHLFVADRVRRAGGVTLDCAGCRGTSCGAAPSSDPDDAAPPRGGTRG
jgi:hypothetical protein